MRHPEQRKRMKRSKLRAQDLAREAKNTELKDNILKNVLEIANGATISKMKKSDSKLDEYFNTLSPREKEYYNIIIENLVVAQQEE